MAEVLILKTNTKTTTGSSDIPQNQHQNYLSLFAVFLKTNTKTTVEASQFPQNQHQNYHLVVQ